MSKKINNKIDELTKKVDTAVTSFKEYLIEKEKEIYAKIAGYFTKHEHNVSVEPAQKVTHSDEPTAPLSTVQSKSLTKPRKAPQKKTTSARKTAIKPKLVVNDTTKESVALDTPTESLEAMGNVAKNMANKPIVKKTPVKKKSTVAKKCKLLSQIKLNQIVLNLNKKWLGLL